jgi:hypothetical protein
MFYTRLNHLLMTAVLLVWLLPLGTSSAWHDVAAAVSRVHVAPVLAYAAVIAAGLVLFAAHTWWYAGHFSIVYGTSFGRQQTGLGPATIGSPAVWKRIGEAVAAQLSMREPPALDPRSLLVVVGALLGALALLQVPIVSRLPASLTITTIGAIAGSFVAYTHDYPGRMSVHIVPFAIGVAVCAAEQVSRRWRRRRPVLAARPCAPARLHA